LRGIAILSVLLFHGGFSSFSGGFVGVDVFFVISGYLMAGIILREIHAGTFSIAAFYERRIRRIFPALFLTILASLAAAVVLLVPVNLKEMADSAVAMTLFASNAFFWMKSGYFDGPSDYKPLLHTWSLAVEEQFYIAFPLLLLAIRRFGRSRFFFWLYAVCAASFALSVYETSRSPVAAFYLVPTRAWELILGRHRRVRRFTRLDAFPLAQHLRIRRTSADRGECPRLRQAFPVSRSTRPRADGWRRLADLHGDDWRHRRAAPAEREGPGVRRVDFIFALSVALAPDRSGEGISDS
jgi:peptidoglycan/LPS O-acetylase OafA/YrhL